MDRRTFEVLVSKVRTDHAIWFDRSAPDSPAGEEALVRVEEELGALLPPDFRWFLATYGGGDFALARVYSADADSDLYIVDNQPLESVALVAFADDGTGLQFAFPIEQGTCVDRVQIWDFETNERLDSHAGDFLGYLSRAAFLLNAYS